MSTTTTQGVRPRRKRALQASQPMLQVRGLVKIYGMRRVVNGVDFDVYPGEIVGLLGPNGAGKTTTFRMTCGMLEPNAGKVVLGEHDVTSWPMYLRARDGGMGYLAQEASVFRKLSVADNILAVLQIRQDLNRQTRRDQLEGLLHELHIGHLADQPGISLSGGERRRVEIARALAANPRFILLDEPFAGVDPISVIDIQQIIMHLCERGIGVLITDHNVRETLGICHHAYIISQGRVIAACTPEAVLGDQQVREVYLGDEFQL